MTYSKCLCRWLCPLAIGLGPLLHAAPSSVQPASTGAITGRVFNPATGEYVRNAEVRIQGTTLVAYSEPDGAFQFGNVPAGEVTLIVIYTGYHPATESFSLIKGRTAAREINIISSTTGAKLADGAIKLREFVVSSDREGNAKAIMEQRNNMNISTSVASDVFGDVPDGNVGEFMKYLPGVDLEYINSQARTPRLGGLDPQYTGVAIDGMKLASADGQIQYGTLENSSGGEAVRSVGFDQMSLNSVEAVEISRTLSADMDADAPAGRINLKMKRAFDLKGRRINYQCSLGLNSEDFTLTKTWGPNDHKTYKARPNFIFGYSESLLNNRLGLLFNVSQAKTYNEQHILENIFNRTRSGADQRPVVITQISYQDLPVLTDRFSTTFTADYKASTRLTLSMNAIFSSYEHLNGSRVINFTAAANGTAAATGRQTVLGDGLTTVQTNGLASNTSRQVGIGGPPQGKRTNTITYNPKFDYRLGRLKLEGALGYSHSKNHYEALRLGYATPANDALGGIDFRATRPSRTSPTWTITQLSGPDWSNLANHRNPSMNDISSGRLLRVDIYNGQLDSQYTLPFRSPSVIKVGGKMNEELRQSEDSSALNRWAYNGPGSGATGSWASIPSGHPFDIGNWLNVANMPAMASREAVATLFREHPEYFTPSGTVDQYFTSKIANNRDFLQRVAAGYGMANTRLGMLQLQGGLRWERTLTVSKEWNPLTAAQVGAAGFTINPSTRRANTIPGLQYQYFSQARAIRKGVYDNWFPSASVKINLNRQFIMQIGYNRAISRPPINVLSGVWGIDDQTRTVIAPNPSLRPEVSDNIVARIAHYFEPVGSFTFQVSQNEITHLRESHEYTADEFGYGADPDYSSYTFISTSNNLQRRRFRGMESAYNRVLSFLPGPLSSANISLAYTRNYADIRRGGLAPQKISANLDRSAMWGSGGVPFVNQA